MTMAGAVPAEEAVSWSQDSVTVFDAKSIKKLLSDFDNALDYTATRIEIHELVDLGQQSRIEELTNLVNQTHQIREKVVKHMKMWPLKIVLDWALTRNDFSQDLLILQENCSRINEILLILMKAEL